MTHVDADIAVKEMTTLWRSFGLEVSSPLQDTWRRMCMALNEAGNSSVGWTTLAMPTGIGKTQFTALYCALLEAPSLSLDNIRSNNLHPGVLFVTRLVSEAKTFTDHVNKLAGRTIAAAYYGGSDTKLSDAANFPVLSITHAACERHQSCGKNDSIGGNTWEQLTTWQLGSRGKLIIDETPNFISSTRIDTKELAQTIGALAWLRGANRELYANMKRLLVASTDTTVGSRNRRITDAEFEHIHSIDTALILDHLKSIDDDAITLGPNTGRTSLRKTCTDTIEAISGMQRNGWGWISHNGLTAQIHSAALHPSLLTGSGLILDATAGLYPGYGLLSPPAKIIPAAENTRRYDNVTLHLAWGQVGGKDNLVRAADYLWPEYRAAIQSILPVSSRILVCCHEEFEQKVCNDPSNPARMTFAHYGNIDGRNDWNDYEAVALVGLFYLPVAAHINTAQALLGPQTNDWLQDSQFRAVGTNEDVVIGMQRAHLAATVIQTVNRVRCRRVIDEEGHCLPTKVFLALPADAVGRAIRDAILRYLPGIQITAWPLNARKKRARHDRGIKKLLDFFACSPKGNYTKAQIRKLTPIGAASLDRAIRRLNDPSSSEYAQLSELSVTYHLRNGRGAESFFVKA
ncbi:hypothetical protein [Bradyrhizobium acaciae]|uniref:hypothetical protein n=1 Tax=Bradyrhizobium acaciae TaxID=2683706 RepID=UPI001E569207|nr:hypothetical protein [Bradyrhizobium acaciae]MCC8980922.1 hypothetical protein [Bradyrhizobium acaciae]